MIQISTNGRISIDGQMTQLHVTQTGHKTLVYTGESPLSGRAYCEHPMPYQRYSTAHRAPASGVAGRDQFEVDIRGLWAALSS